MNKNYWKNKKVLITGYEGFMGSNLTRRLIALGADIIGLDIKVRRDQTLLTNADYAKITIVSGDVADYKLVKKLISRHKVEIVFHLAAEAIVAKSLADPLRTFSSNIQGTWNLLEACRSHKRVGAIVIASSDKAYGSHKKLPYKEAAPLRGNHPYDVSKSCADLLAFTYYHTFDLPVATTRCGNIYGPGDFNFSRIIPDIMRSLILNKKLFIRSDGRFIRDYVYVDDIVDGYILLAEKLQKKNLAGEAFNFSDEAPLSVLGLLQKVYQLVQKKPNHKILNQAPYEIKRQYLSSAKARKMLGWRPRYNLAKGLLKTFGWYASTLRPGG